jgi:hypothetical protein
MHNVATIYRFYSPFLDFSNEKKSLILLIRRIQEVLVFDSLKFKEESFQENNFYNIILKLEGDIGKIEL